MANPVEIDQERTEFLENLERVYPQLAAPAKAILESTVGSLTTVETIQKVLDDQDCVDWLLKTLDEKIEPKDLESTSTSNTPKCYVWSSFGVILMLQGKMYQAIEVLDALYTRLLCHQINTGERFHKGLPLFYMSQCYQRLGWMVHAKRYMMLTLCEDAVSDTGKLNLQNSHSYGRLAWVFGLSESQIKKYREKAYAEYKTNEREAAMPEWILQKFDQQWKSEVPSDQEAGTYHITPQYCQHLMGKLGGGDGKALEHLAHYLVGSMPGCRAYVRGRTFSTDHDVVASVEGPIADFRSELGRYFVCECKDRKKKANFADVAKFCRVLDSVKAKFGVIFSPNGLTGEGEAKHADREVLKVYQDRGIVIVVINRADLQSVAHGANFISLLREKYEIVRLDLRGALA